MSIAADLAAAEHCHALDFFSVNVNVNAYGVTGKGLKCRRHRVQLGPGLPSWRQWVFSGRRLCANAKSYDRKRYIPQSAFVLWHIGSLPALKLRCSRKMTQLRRSREHGLASDYNTT